MELGTYVRLKRNPSTAGILLEGERLTSDARMVPLQLANGQKKWFPYSALEPVPKEPESSWDRFAAGRFVGPDWLRRTLTRLRVTGRLSEVVYSMEATETDFYAYQFKPVIKLMNSPTDALLIADEVGLGKTIEAGLIWTELRARLDCNRLLVVCPKTLCQKWKDELAQRFGVEAQIADARGLVEVLQTARRTGRGYALVCSMQGLRPPSGWDKDDELEGADAGHSARRELARFLDEESDGVPLIDLLVVDEAHHMRNPDTLLHRFGQLANSVASHRLFLSATPIHLQNRDLHSLLVMVDPDTFEFENTLNDLIETNAPIIAARELLLDMNTSVEEIKKKIQEARNHEILRQSKALTQIWQELSTTNLDSSKRSELAARLERVSQLANYVTRTRRRDVEAFRVVRDPKLPFLDMSPEERHFYDEITTVVKDYAFYQDVAEPFLLSMPQRLLTSSMAAASAYWCGLANGNNEEDVEESDQDLLLGQLQDDRPLVAQIAECAELLGMTERLIENDTKYHLLVRELRQLWETDIEAKIIVFSSFKPTLRYLWNRLREDDIGAELLHGSVNRPRAQILEHFRTNDTIRVLLSSEVGSEGVDLQFSSTVVNYDLPWNPMRLEQRIGRVDRLGQTKDVVMILNLIYNDTIDKRIYDRLYDRLDIGRRALGEMEAILGEPIHRMTMKLLNPGLTETQKEEAIEKAALVLEGQRLIEEQIEAEAGALVQHGDYIIERIRESRDQHRWLSGHDILIYVRDRMLQNFPGSTIEASPTGSDTYQIKLSNEGATAFQIYLNQHGIVNQTRLPYPDAQHRFCFTSSVVQKNNRVECISQLHPLVRFTASLDLDDENVRNAQAVAVNVSLETLPAECEAGFYVFAVGHWSSGSTATNTMTDVRIGYVGANVTSGDLIGSTLAERMIAVAAECGRPIPNAAMHGELADATRILQDMVQFELDRRFEEFVGQVKAETEDRVVIRRRSLNRHFEGKIDILEKNRTNLIEQAEFTIDTKRATKLRNLAAARKAKIERLHQTWQWRKSTIDDQLTTTPELSDVCCLLMQVDTLQQTEEIRHE